MERDRSLVRLGWWLLLLGWLSLFRLIPEWLALRRAKDVYLWISLVDVLIGVATLFASSGLLHRRPWGPRLAICSGALAVACSLVWGVPTAALFFSSWSAGTWGRQELALSPRLAYDLLVLAAWPWAFWVLLESPNASEERFGRLSIWFVGFLSLSMAVAWGIWKIQWEPW